VEFRAGRIAWGAAMECTDWKAWVNRRSRARPVLFVEGRCHLPSAGFTVELRRYRGGRPGTGPAIVGPPVLAPSAAPPVFLINPGPGRFYAVEVTTRPELFDRARQGAQRNADNFYGSWGDLALRRDPEYSLPEGAWRRLVAGPDVDRLCYRIWTSTSADDWRDPVASTPNAEYRRAPCIFVVEDAAASATVLERTVHPPLVPQANVPVDSVARYSEEVDAGPRWVVVLPDGVLLPVDVVP
jgi:hypothetical protein